MQPGHAWRGVEVENDRTRDIMAMADRMIAQREKA